MTTVDDRRTLLGRILNPDVQRHLMRDRHETVVDPIIRRHWFVFVRPAFEAGVALFLLYVGLGVIQPADNGSVVWMLGAAVGAHAGWVVLRERRETFVVTSNRVFRLHGVLDTHRASMPLTRILDITVDKPLHGRLLGFGHLTFESAAQNQGLSQIRYVAQADAREKMIQTVVYDASHSQQATPARRP